METEARFIGLEWRQKQGYRAVTWNGDRSKGYRAVTWNGDRSEVIGL